VEFLQQNSPHRGWICFVTNANGDCLRTRKPNRTCGKCYALFVVGDGFSTSNSVAGRGFGFFATYDFKGIHDVEYRSDVAFPFYVGGAI